MDLAGLQDWLDRMDRAVTEGDFADYAARVVLPFALETRTATLSVASLAELRAGFDSWRQMLAAQRVTHSVRRATDVRRIGPDSVRGSFDSYLLAGAIPVVPPMGGTVDLHRDEAGLWRATRIVTEMANARWPIDLPRPARRAGASTPFADGPMPRPDTRGDD
ncbi:hypothetical protein [Roseicyclus persicicus]|uniref:SnoaL-like domain-containing protein n=1 Tax=Roseicyclus persicicus TaxID=2650661 RepID=A0A7X6JX99_9RHOB|nr:hypothetical protein [Roseibacterium persicicum]NKX44580.1 hypothetical protein [Roseibacterium persicicum]